MKYLLIANLLTISFCSSAQLGLLDLVQRNLDKTFAITASHQGDKTEGVIVLEENHIDQFASIDQLLAIYKDQAGSQFDQIVLEGLDHTLQSTPFIFDSSQATEQQIFQRCLRRQVISRKYMRNYFLQQLGNLKVNINNAEFLHLAYGFNLLPSENTRDYLDCQNFSAYADDSPLPEIYQKEGIIYSNVSNEEDVDQLRKYIKHQSKSSEGLESYSDVLKFYTLVTKRTDTISARIKSYFAQHKKLFCIIGMKHTARLLWNLRHSNIPYVVIAEKSNLWLDSARMKIKPAPIIESPEFKVLLEKTYLKALIAHAIEKGIDIGNYLSRVSVRKILSQFHEVKDISYEGNSISYMASGSPQKLSLAEIRTKEIDQIIHDLKSDFPTTFEPTESQPLGTLKDHPDWTIFRKDLSTWMHDFLASKGYLENREYNKYFFNDGKPSTEVHWSDQIVYLPLKEKFPTLLQQCAIAKGMRPDWYMPTLKGNWIGEVKYIRNKATFAYVKKLLVNNQIERYLSDPYLNAKALDVIVFIDREGLAKEKISDKEIDAFLRLLNLRILHLRQNLGKNIQLMNFNVRIETLSFSPLA